MGSHDMHREGWEQRICPTPKLSPANPPILKKCILEREEGGGGGEREGNISVASHMHSYGGSKLQPRYVHGML